MVVLTIEGAECFLLQTPDVAWNDVVGVPESKKLLMDLIILPIEHQRKPGTTVLLCGVS